MPSVRFEEFDGFYDAVANKRYAQNTNPTLIFVTDKAKKNGHVGYLEKNQNLSLQYVTDILFGFN